MCINLVANSAKTQFRITRWNSNLKARSLLSSNGNIWAQNASNLLENPPFESVFGHLVNYGRIISVSGLYMNQNTLELMQLFFAPSKFEPVGDQVRNSDVGH